METTHRHASIMVGMLDKLKGAGVTAPTVENIPASA
jgi:hypothetical protein